MAKLTPMQRQYYELKDQTPGAILLFRLGDFYEMFDEDAIKASKILDITLTARQKGGENEMKMCGMPYHSAEGYINKLTKAGEKVAICEQVSDPILPGIVERKVVRIITPGTVLSENMLDHKSSNYLVSVSEYKGHFGLAYSDISTGQFCATTISSFQLLKDEILRLNPAEILLTKDSSLESEVHSLGKNVSFWFTPPNPEKTLKDFFKVPHLKVFYIENEKEVIHSAAMLLDYIMDTQRGATKQIVKIQKYSNSDYLPIDYSTLKNLEVFSTLQEGKYQGSLLSVIDTTQTASGGRKLKNWLIKPLKDIQSIQQRLERVSDFCLSHKKREQLRVALKETRDIERILGRVASGRSNPKDLLALKETLKNIPEIRSLVQSFSEK
ncbi:hypothetical protein HON22_00005 [Candidatus Peregrinibacteria bacterium]|nr:hypothetical protein [Candidatus Peregrinibacteria bacterium]